jgi:hypothetical protein
MARSHLNCGAVGRLLYWYYKAYDKAYNMLTICLWYNCSAVTCSFSRCVPATTHPKDTACAKQFPTGLFLSRCCADKYGQFFLSRCCADKYGRFFLLTRGNTSIVNSSLDSWVYYIIKRSNPSAWPTDGSLFRRTYIRLLLENKPTFIPLRDLLNDSIFHRVTIYFGSRFTICFKF